VHPKVLIDDLLRETKRRAAEKAPDMPDLFADFNGLPDVKAKTEFYQHDANWANRMILGDSLNVMASLAEREGLRGKIQCIYIDPPYGIKFNSNFQWSTTSRDVKDGAKDHITREPEQVRAFRDTWRDGIHSYLTYLRDRLTVARDLLHESGSIFVQIGDENVHRVRALMDEVFGAENQISDLVVEKTAGASMAFIDSVADFVLWYAKDRATTKYRQLYNDKKNSKTGLTLYKFVEDSAGFRRELSQHERDTADGITSLRIFTIDALTSQTQATTTRYLANFRGEQFASGVRQWVTPPAGLERLKRANRVDYRASSIGYVRFYNDHPVIPIRNIWTDTGTGSFTDQKIYIVQTGNKVVERCLLMATDPGDLVLDPTCGSGTTAYVAEQWGRRWITIDTSRVALALARTRLMSARYPYYLLADSREGRAKEQDITGRPAHEGPTHGDIRQGFVYARVPHVTLKSIANNAEISVIWDKWQPKVAEALARLNAALRGHKKPFRVTTGGRKGQDVRFDAPEGSTFTMPSGEAVKAYELVEWEVPREAPADWPAAAKQPLAAFWEARITRQKEIDASIAAHADFEYLYDKSYVDNSRVRVAGPFTVESLSPHRVLAVDADDRLIPGMAEPQRRYRHNGSDSPEDFADMILENLRIAGIQQAHKEDRISFTSLVGWPGKYVCAEGRFMVGREERRAGILIGPKFGILSSSDLVAAAAEADDAGFDVLVACAFSYDAYATDLDKFGRMLILKACMNPDLHMGNDLKTTSDANLFILCGKPNIALETISEGMIRVRIKGIDIFKPQTGEIESGGTESIALWMIDTDYNEESFFVRHAYFLGANDPYKTLKTMLKAEIDEAAWASLNSDVSRPFPKPASGRIAVKVINHLGDEVMKVFSVK